MNRPDDAALLAEADQMRQGIQSRGQRPAWEVAVDLSVALREALQREQEMRDEIVALKADWQYMTHEALKHQDRALAAERELSTLRARKEQEDTRSDQSGVATSDPRGEGITSAQSSKA